MAETPPVVSFMQKSAAFSMEQKQKAVPAYTVEPQTRTTTVNRTVKDDFGFRIVPTVVELQGFMVRTLRGDSVFITQDDFVRMKLDRNLVPLVMEGGDDTPVGAMQLNNTASLTDKQQQALDVLSKLIENDPSLVEKLLAEKAPEEVEDE